MKQPRRGRPAQHWVDMVRTHVWREAVCVASGGLSNSDLDREVVAGTKWQSRAKIDRLQMFERATTMLPGRGKRPRACEADVIALADVRWPGTAAIFEHPVWECWKNLPKSFSQVVASVDRGLNWLSLMRDRESIELLGFLAFADQTPAQALKRFEVSVGDVIAKHSILDQLFLLTILFREADILRMPSAAHLMSMLSDAIAAFGSSELGGLDDVQAIEDSLLYARWSIELDDYRTVTQSLDALAPLVRLKSDCR